MKRKAQFLDKAKKDRLRVANSLLRSFCKGWGASTKQRWGMNARVQSIRKVGSVCKGCGQIAKAFRECGRNAKGQPKLPSAINIYTSFKPEG